MIAREGRDVGGPAANSGGGGAEPRQWWNAAAAAAVRVGAAQVWRRGALRGAAGRGSAASPAVQVLSRAAGNRGAAAMSTFRQESVEDFYEMGEELGR